MAEWSKAIDSSSILFGGVSSNLTGRTSFCFCFIYLFICFILFPFLCFCLKMHADFKQKKKNTYKYCTSAAGFEPTRAEPIGFQVQRLNHSAILTIETNTKRRPKEK